MTAAELRFALLGSTVLVRCGCSDALERLRVCYAGAPAADAGAPDLEAGVARTQAGWELRVAGRDAVRADDLESAVRGINHELMQALMQAAPQLFYVHAAVVAVAGAAIVLPGMSRAGKSTLALALARRGACLLSDELLVYDPPRRAVLPFLRAPKLRDPCVRYFPELAAHCVGSGEARFVPLAALGGDAVPGEARARLVVVPRWDPDAGDALLPRSAGESLLALAESALNFGARRSGSIDHLAALAADARHFSLRWRDPHAAAGAILAALHGAP